MRPHTVFPPAFAPFPRRRYASARRIGILSTYPPKICGLATFASALAEAIWQAGDRVRIVRIRDARDARDDAISPTAGRFDGEELVNGDPDSIRSAAAVLSRCDTVIIQHEYGIFGGTDGDEILDVLRALTVPSIVVLHTVPLRPTPNQRAILVAIADLADRLVVMTRVARDRLLSLYPVDPDKVETISHGASSPMPAPTAGALAGRYPAPQLLTWGLLGPGKGIEHAIDALALLRDLPVVPRYTIAGVTHPNVVARDGDVYRNALIGQSRVLGLGESVQFDATYRNVAELTRFVTSASVVVLPYDSRDQVTSGVLVDAIAAGRPVIATAFPHAVELLGTGAGIVVPHGDPPALAAAIRSVLTDDTRLAAMAAEARRIAPSLQWSSVAHSYIRLSDALVRVPEPVAI